MKFVQGSDCAIPIQTLADSIKQLEDNQPKCEFFTKKCQAVF